MNNSCFESINVGDIIRHSKGRTITHTDEIWFTLFTTSTNQLHFNSDYASKSVYKKSMVNAPLILAVIAGMISNDFSKAIELVGWKKIKIVNPLFLGETIYATSIITDKIAPVDLSSSGIIEITTTGEIDGKAIIEIIGQYRVSTQNKGELL